MLEYECLKQNDLFSTIKRNTVSANSVRSPLKHIDNIVIVERIVNNDILEFTETQINPSDSTCKIIKKLNFFNINFNTENRFLSLPYRSRNNVAILDKFDANGVSIFSPKEHAFGDIIFILMLV